MAAPQVKPIEHPWIDASEAPLYKLTYPVGATEEEVQRRHDEIAAWYHEVDYPLVWLVDCTHVASASAGQRKIIGEHQKEVEGPSRKYNSGTGIIVPNALVRGILTAIYWLSPPPYPYKLFSNAQDAMQYTREQLDAAYAAGVARAG